MANDPGLKDDIDVSTARDGPDPVLVDTLKALAHPIRLRIVQVLADKQQFGLDEESCCAKREVCVCRLNGLFDISAPTLSHHIRLLREAGLIEGRRDGVWIYYSILPGALDPLSRAIEALRVPTE